MYSYFLPKAVFIINVFKTFLTVQQFDLQIKLGILFTYWQAHEMFGTYRIGGAVLVRGSYDVTAMCLRATGLRFFRICHCAELIKIVETLMPVNPYDDRKVSLRRPHRNSDLDIVRASYTRRKANVTEA